MKINGWIKIALIMILVLFVFGCAKKKVTEEPGAAQPTVQPAEPTAPAGPSDEERRLAEQRAQAARELEASTIYFDFDKSELKPPARDKLNKVADIMKRYSNINVLIEGHCDERGTEEYNLALGERRARAAYNFLSNMGISSDRLKIISYGEEYPAVQGHNEEAWSKNRRDEFKVY